MSERVVILGGTTGLGKAIAEEYADKNALVTIVGRVEPETSRGHMSYSRCDLASTDQVIANSLIQCTGLVPPDRFFWVAGTHASGPFDGMRLSDILYMTNVNFVNGVIYAGTMYKAMRRRGKSLTVVSSTSGIRPRPNEALYAATKHAQVGFVRSLAGELADTSLKLSLFLPGGMRTQLYRGEKLPKDYDAFMDPKVVAKHIVDKVDNQKDPYMEVEIPRGSL